MLSYLIHRLDSPSSPINETPVSNSKGLFTSKDYEKVLRLILLDLKGELGGEITYKEFTKLIFSQVNDKGVIPGDKDRTSFFYKFLKSGEDANFSIEFLAELTRNIINLKDKVLSPNTAVEKIFNEHAKFIEGIRTCVEVDIFLRKLGIDSENKLTSRLNQNLWLSNIMAISAKSFISAIPAEKFIHYKIGYFIDQYHEHNQRSPVDDELEKLYGHIGLKIIRSQVLFEADRLKSLSESIVKEITDIETIRKENQESINTLVGVINIHLKAYDESRKNREKLIEDKISNLAKSSKDSNFTLDEKTQRLIDAIVLIEKNSTRFPEGHSLLPLPHISLLEKMYKRSDDK